VGEGETAAPSNRNASADVALASRDTARLGTTGPAGEASSVEFMMGQDSASAMVNATESYLYVGLDVTVAGDFDIAAWALEARLDTLMTLDAILGGDGQSGAANDWRARFMTDADSDEAAPQLVDITRLYDSAYSIELDRSDTREIDLTRPQVKYEDSELAASNVRTRAYDALLARFDLRDVLFALDEEDEDQRVFEASDETNVDAFEAAIDSIAHATASIGASTSATAGMIELTHETERESRTKGRESTSSAGHDVGVAADRGGCVNTDGGTARYQAFDIASNASLMESDPQARSLDAIPNPVSQTVLGTLDTVVAVDTELASGTDKSIEPSKGL